MSKGSSTKSAAGTELRNPKMERILNCAEKEFAAHGYSDTPLHRIAASAKVNQALVSYYFNSKEQLYRAVFLRRGVELTRERLRLLDELESRESEPPTVEELVTSFVVPAISLRYQGNDRRNFLRLQARLQNEPREITAKLRATVYDEATRRYIESFKRALPDIDPAAIVFRMVMMIGAYLYVVSDPNRLEQLSDGHCDAEDQAEVIRQVCAFLTGGFKYPLESAPGAVRESRPPARRVAR